MLQSFFDCLVSLDFVHIYDMLLNTLLGVAAITSSFTAAVPTANEKLMGRTENGINERQDVDGEDIETEGATDQLRDGMCHIPSTCSTATDRHQ